MLSILQQLILSDYSGADGLTQPEREAIVDALHYCMYADSALALTEAKVVDDWQETLTWNPGLPFSTYEPRSIAAARLALESDENRREFINGIAARMQSKRARETLMRLCRKMADADGRRADQEWSFIEALRMAVGAA
jgi:uncharacterized tellurite resistance protein B-like protein